MHILPSQQRHLEAMFERAVASDPSDRLICPYGEHSYTTLFSIIPDVLAVLRAALPLESDKRRLLDWYLSEPIAWCEHFTAAQMVAFGRADEVVAFLQAITPAATLLTALCACP